MAKQKAKDRDDPQTAKDAGKQVAADNEPADAAGGQHHAARPHGQPSKVDTTLPATRAELLALHAEARGRRNAAPLDSAEFRAAVEDIERIEVRVAAIERAQDPPLG